MSALNSLGNAAVRDSAGPAWKGPCVDGITNSLIMKFLACPERFRVRTILGLKPQDKFSHYLEYGNFWHLCKEHDVEGSSWQDALEEYADQLMHKYRSNVDDIAKWRDVCRLQYGVFTNVGANSGEDHPKHFTLIEPESEFKVEYILKSGRKVILRGKRDGLYLDDGNLLWLREDKSKGEVNQGAVEQQLTFDAQTGLYLTTVMTEEEYSKVPIGGVEYNVIRRPLSGGKGTIVQKKPSKSNPNGESWVEFLTRLHDEYLAATPEEYFFRWYVPITSEQVMRFRELVLDPLLERICRWYDWVTSPEGMLNPFSKNGGGGLHYVQPFGGYNPTNEGNYSEVDAFIMNGTMVGLVRDTNMFPELSKGDE